MITCPAQYHGFRVTTMGDRIITFRVDELYADSVKDIISEKIGTEYVLALVPVTEATNYEKEKEPDSLARKFQKKMHMRISELAELTGESSEKTKERLKAELVKKGMIKESTKELDVKNAALAVNIIEKWINEYSK